MFGSNITIIPIWVSHFLACGQSVKYTRPFGVSSKNAIMVLSLLFDKSALLSIPSPEGLKSDALPVCGLGSLQHQKGSK